MAGMKMYTATLVYLELRPEIAVMAEPRTPPWHAEERVRRGEHTVADIEWVMRAGERMALTEALFDLDRTYWCRLLISGGTLQRLDVWKQGGAPEAKITSGETMRRIPITAMLRDARAAEVLSLDAGEPEFSGDPRPMPQGEREARLVALRALPRAGKRGREGYDEAHYRRVARVAREGIALGLSPNKSVMDHFYVSKSTASRWLKNASELGLDRGGPKKGEE